MQTFLRDLRSHHHDIDDLITNISNRVAGNEDLIDDLIANASFQQLLREAKTNTELAEIINSILLVDSDSCILRKTHVTKMQKLSSIKRFVTAMAKDDLVDDTDPSGAAKTPTMFLPPLQKGQMVLVNFSGIGSEIDDEHFAIVWDDVTATMDNIIIIPTKSFKPKYKEYKNAFSIGRVGTFRKETWVDVKQITSISRKRIKDYRFETRSGSGIFREVYISTDQEKRILDGIKASWVGEMTLLERILNNNKQRVPELENISLQGSHLFRPTKLFRTDASRDTTIYCLYGDTTEYKIIWHDPTAQMTISSRRRKVNNWAYATAEYDASGALVKSRSQAKSDTYDDLQSLRR